MSAFRIAAAQSAVFAPSCWMEFGDTITASVLDAANRGARLLVFPEYGAMSLTGIFDDALRADLAGQIVALQRFRDDYVALHRELARRHGVYLLAGSFPWQLENGGFCNRAWFFGPSGAWGYQDKQVMTRFERELWGISTNGPLRVFDTELGCIGINICYDIEFPLLPRAQAEAGAVLLLAPSCTDTLHGYWRVRVGAQARALENQCIVVQAPLVGEAPWSPAVDCNIGAAGVYGPPDVGFPADGVIAVGEMNAPGWVMADVDTEAVIVVREKGDVFNHRHWGERWGSGAGIRTSVERVRI